MQPHFRQAPRPAGGGGGGGRYCSVQAAVPICAGWACGGGLGCGQGRQVSHCSCRKVSLIYPHLHPMMLTCHLRETKLLTIFVLQVPSPHLPRRPRCARQGRRGGSCGRRAGGQVRRDAAGAVLVLRRLGRADGLLRQQRAHRGSAQRVGGGGEAGRGQAPVTDVASDEARQLDSGNSSRRGRCWEPSGGGGVSELIGGLLGRSS
mmetsp:Transcript_17030/g.46695  ORF Transcript_17030/g.46695 Transcript_17030/m.46695 type:complete len:205 (-) Transcript_17030:380-994(-)